MSNDILNAHFRTIGKDYSHFIFQEDINGRLWIIRPVMEFFLSYCNTGMFFRGLKYKDDKYMDMSNFLQSIIKCKSLDDLITSLKGFLKKETVNIIEGNFFYDWDLTVSNEARLRYTVDRFNQGDFVKDSRAFSMAQMSDYFRKTIAKKDEKKKLYHLLEYA